MDWIKVKTKHYLHTSMSFSEIGAMVTIQLLTAHFERIPTEKEIKKHIHYKTLKSLQAYLNENSINLQEVLNKVLKDVQHTANLREKGKQKMANWRDKKKNVTSNVTSIDKIREDKIREDKIREDKIREDKIRYIDFVYMTAKEHDKLVDKLGDKKTNDLIERLNDYIGSKGVKYKSHYHTIMSWDRKDGSSTTKTFKQIDQDREKEVISNFLNSKE